MKFLIVRLSSLGDVIHALPIVYALRKQYPKAKIDWLTGNKGYELLSLIKELDNVYLADLKNLSLVKEQNYDYVIDAQGLFKSAFLSKLVKGKKIIGFKEAREFASIFYDVKIETEGLFNSKTHIVNLNLELLDGLIEKESFSDIKFLIPKIFSVENAFISDLVKVNDAKPSVVIFPCTTWDSKHWKLDYWYESISALSKQYVVYICASKADLELISPLISKLDLNNIKYKNLIGKTKIKDLIYLIQHSDLVIGLDSAGLHLASAIKNDHSSPEVIGIYGPTSVIRNGPYNLSKDCLSLQELECISCRKKKCPLGHHKCMNDIYPGKLLKMADSKIKAVC